MLKALQRATGRGSTLTPAQMTAQAAARRAGQKPNRMSSEGEDPEAGGDEDGDEIDPKAGPDASEKEAVEDDPDTPAEGDDPDAEDDADDDGDGDGDDDADMSMDASAARSAERARCSAILNAPEAAANPGLANHYAFNTSDSAAKAIAAMKAAAATGGTSLDTRMKTQGQAGSSSGTGRGGSINPGRNADAGWGKAMKRAGVNVKG